MNPLAIVQSARTDPQTEESPLRSALREMGQGITMGWGDELTGGLGAAMSGFKPGAYTSIRDAEREAHNSFQNLHPWRATTSDILGSLLTGKLSNSAFSGIAGMVPGAGNAARITRNIINNPIAQSAPIGAAARVGADPSAVGSGNTARDVVGGAGNAAALTTGLTVAVKGLGVVGRALGMAVDKHTANALLEALKRDGINPQDFLGKATIMEAQTGKPLSYADLAAIDPKAVNTVKLFQDALARAPGDVRGPALENLADRAAGQKERIIGDFADKAGATELPKTYVFDQLYQARKDAASPFYESAFQDKMPIVDQRLTDMYNRPSMQAALSRIKKLSAEMERPMDVGWTSTPADIPPALLTGEVKSGLHGFYTPNIENLDTIKKTLKAIEEDAMVEDKHVPGKWKDTPESIAYRATFKQFTKLLDELGPEDYQTARRLHGDYTGMLEGYQLGTNFQKTDPAAIDKYLSDTDRTQAEKDAFVSGVYGQLSELGAAPGSDWVKKIAGDSRKMEQLKAAFGGDTDALNDFIQKLQVESAMAKSAKTYTGKGEPEPFNPTSLVSASVTPSAVVPRVTERLAGLFSGPSKPVSKRLTQFGFAPVGNADRMVQDLMFKPQEPGWNPYLPAANTPALFYQSPPAPTDDVDQSAKP